jgi:hypothetical protein
MIQSNRNLRQRPRDRSIVVEQLADDHTKERER